MFRYQQKDIVLISFPFTDGSASKQRPVLIISSNDINRSGLQDFIGLAITSVLRREKYSIVISDNDCEKGKLFWESEIQTYKIATIQKDKAIKKLCTLKDGTYQRVVEKIKQALHLK